MRASCRDMVRATIRGEKLRAFTRCVARSFFHRGDVNLVRLQGFPIPSEVKRKF